MNRNSEKDLTALLAYVLVGFIFIAVAGTFFFFGLSSDDGAAPMQPLSEDELSASARVEIPEKFYTPENSSGAAGQGSGSQGAGSPGNAASGSVVSDRGYLMKPERPPFAELDEEQQSADFAENSDRPSTRGAIRGLDDPPMAETNEQLKQNDYVIGVALDGQVKAYPLRSLGEYQIANDMCGNVPIAICWCPLSQTALVYDRRLDGTTLSFDHDVLFYRETFVIYDRGSDSRWINNTGYCVQGDWKGKRLKTVASCVMRWSLWKDLYPESQVMSAEPGSMLLGTYGLETHGSGFGYSVGNGAAPMLLMVGLLRRDRVFQEEIDGQNVVVFFDATRGVARAWLAEEREFRWDADSETFVDRDDLPWNMLTGRCLGPDSDAQLGHVSCTPWLVEKWKGFYPVEDIRGL